MEAELKNKCLFCRRKPLEFVAPLGKRSLKDIGPEVFSKWNTDSINSLCRLFYVAPEHKLFPVFKKVRFCEECQNLMWDANINFKMIDTLQSKISDIRSTLNRKLELNCRHLRRKHPFSEFSDIAYTPASYTQVVNVCYQG